MNIKKIGKIFGALIILFVVITGYLIKDIEQIPDNAKIYLIHSRKLWLPDAKFVDEVLEYQKTIPEISSGISSVISEKEFGIYSDVKSGNFKDYKLPETWQKDYSRIKIGRMQSILRSWLFPKQKRWGTDGSWNW